MLFYVFIESGVSWTLIIHPFQKLLYPGQGFCNLITYLFIFCKFVRKYHIGTNKWAGPRLINQIDRQTDTQAGRQKERKEESPVHTSTLGQQCQTQIMSGP